MRKIGITTTVPQEIILSAGAIPVDLNNLFISSSAYLSYIETAEQHGFPKSMCAWIKGIYGACLSHNINEIIGVVEGDCSNTHTLISILERRGIKVHRFGYPYDRSKERLYENMDLLAKSLGTSLSDSEKYLEVTGDMHSLGILVDNLTISGKATGFENHLWLVSQSDFNSDIISYKKRLSSELDNISKRNPKNHFLNLGYIGVPPMTADLYEFVSDFDAGIIYNEIQREFAFPRYLEAKTLTEKYIDYTYPYDINNRISCIKNEIKSRKLDGIIHYTQAFCHRAAEDIIIKSELEIPILHIEGDRLNSLDARTKLRIETFIDMVHDLKRGIL